jgi:hypothetical protein
VQIYDRVNWPWMLNGGTTFSMGWTPESGFISARYDTYCELMMLYLLAMGSTTFQVSASYWSAFSRPVITFQNYTYVSGDDPLFTHQYSHAWIDFRNRRDRGFLDFFLNSVNATRANQQYSQKLGLPSTFTPEIWGITASDGPKGYRIYGEIKAFEPVDGTVAPAAAAGSLMFTPDISIPALKAIRERYGDRIYGRYGFVDGYNPTLDWFDADVVGIDAGITLLSAENLLTGNVWRWFMANEAATHAMELIGFSEPPGTEAKKEAPKKEIPKKKARHTAASAQR